MNDEKSEACFRPKPVSQLQHAFFKCVHIFANVCIRKTKLELEEAVSSEDAQEQLVVFFFSTFIMDVSPRRWYKRGDAELWPPGMVLSNNGKETFYAHTWAAAERTSSAALSALKWKVVCGIKKESLTVASTLRVECCSGGGGGKGWFSSQTGSLWSQWTGPSLFQNFQQALSKICVHVLIYLTKLA